jgi:hypothetical protein
MATPNLQIELGNFVDMEGSPLSNGYLLWELSHDERYSVSNSQIVAGLKIRVTLDTSGNVPTNPATLIYSNDVLTPAGSFYTVRAFKSDGTEAWKSPQYFQLNASPNPLDLGTLVPVNPPGGLIAGGNTSITLQTNSVNNTSQVLLNFVNTSSVTFTNPSGGVVSATATGASFSTAGQGWFWGGQSLAPFPTTSGVNFAPTGVANELTVIELNITYTITVRKLTIFVESGSGGTHFMCGLYSANGNTKVLDAGTNAFSTASTSTAVTVTLGTPVVISPGTYYFACGSDSASATQSPGHQTLNTSQILFNNTVSRYGKAANAIVAGALPATLGAITAFGAIAINVPAVLFEV